MELISKPESGFEQLTFVDGHTADEFDVVYHQKMRFILERYVMKTRVGDNVFEFKLFPNPHDNKLELLIRTEEYHFASIKLTPHEQRIMFLKLRSFLLNVKSHTSNSYSLLIKAYGGSEKKEDIDQMKEQIVQAKPELKSLVNKYPVNVDLYRIYLETFGGEYVKIRGSKDMTGSRFRYFLINFKKYIPELKLVEKDEDRAVLNF